MHRTVLNRVGKHLRTLSSQLQRQKCFIPPFYQSLRTCAEEPEEVYCHQEIPKNFWVLENSRLGSPERDLHQYTVPGDKCNCSVLTFTT